MSLPCMYLSVMSFSFRIFVRFFLISHAKSFLILVSHMNLYLISQLRLEFMLNLNNMLHLVISTPIQCFRQSCTCPPFNPFVEWCLKGQETLPDCFFPLTVNSCHICHISGCSHLPFSIQLNFHHQLPFLPSNNRSCYIWFRLTCTTFMLKFRISTRVIAIIVWGFGV